MTSVARFAVAGMASAVAACAAALALAPSLPEPASTACTIGVGVTAGWTAAEWTRRRRWRVGAALAAGLACTGAWMLIGWLVSGA
jgi:hypothetical protein